MAYAIASRKEFDLAIIGAGGGGLIAAGRAAWLTRNKKIRIVVLEKTPFTGGSGVYPRR